MSLLQRARGDSFSGNTLFIFLSRIFPTLANVIVMVLFSRMLDTGSYGLYQNFWVQVYVLNAVACLGLQAFVVTYKPAVLVGIIRKLQPKHWLLFGGWQVAIALLFCIMQSKGGIPNMPLTFTFLLVHSITVIAESLLIVYRRFGMLVLMNGLYMVGYCAIHWLFLQEHYGIVTMFWYLLLLASVKLIFFLVQVWPLISKAIATEVTRPLAEIRALWLHLGMYDVSQMVFKWIDKFVVSLVLVKELSALYYNGSQDIPFLSLILGAAGSAALMQLSTAQRDNEDKFALQLLHRSSSLLACIVFPLFFFCVCFRTELITVLFSEKYLPAVPIFLVSVMAVPLRAYNFTTILQNRHKGSIINKGAVADLLIAVALMYPLYQLWALPGLALSFVISSYLQAWYYLHHTGKILNLPIAALLPLRTLVKKVIVFGLVLIAFHYVMTQFFAPQIALFWGGLLTMVLSVIALWFEFKPQTALHGKSTT